MRLLFLLCLPGFLFAGESVHVLNLKPTINKKRLHVDTKAVPILPTHIFGNRAYDLSREQSLLQFDGGFREALVLLKTADTIRQKKSSRRQKLSRIRLLSYTIKLAAYHTNGLRAGQIRVKWWMGLTGEPGVGFVYDENTRHTFKLEDLDRDGAYGDFLAKAASHRNHQRDFILLPKGNAYVVELTSTCPEPLKTSLTTTALRQMKTFLKDRDLVYGLNYQLGSALIQKGGDGVWQSTTNATANHFQDAVSQYEKALNLPPEQAIDALETYLTHMPSDAKALTLLMEIYLGEGRILQAGDLYAKYGPLIQSVTMRPNVGKTINSILEQKRAHFQKRLHHFKPAPDASLEIQSPAAEDLIGGLTDLSFDIKNPQSRVMEVVCHLDGVHIATLTKPPFRTRFHPPDGDKRRDLTVIARFEDETHIKKSHPVNVLSVAAAGGVHLIPIRAVATRGKRKFRTDLQKQHLTITENKKPRSILHFRKESKPLTMAVIVDTSISMLGRKRHQAAYSLDTFLNNLEPGDRAALYTFDNMVKRLTPFQEKMADRSSKIYTLTAGGGTSLYDALWAAHQDLINENGSPVIVIISDGADTGSRVKREQIQELFASSPVMVYSIILPGLSKDPKLNIALADGRKFLEDLAQMTGSVSIKVSQTAKLGQTFASIYGELKSFYYLDYQTDLPRDVTRNIEVGTDLLGTRVRFRRMDP